MGGDAEMGGSAEIRVNYRAALVPAVVSGSGTIKANGKEFTLTDGGTVNLLDVAKAHTGVLEVNTVPGLSLRSFTFGQCGDTQTLVRHCFPTSAHKFIKFIKFIRIHKRLGYDGKHEHHPKSI